MFIRKFLFISCHVGILMLIPFVLGCVSTNNDAGMFSVTYSPDGTYIASGSDNTIKKYGMLSDGTLRHTLHNLVDNTPEKYHNDFYTYL